MRLFHIQQTSDLSIENFLNFMLAELVIMRIELVGDLGFYDNIPLFIIIYLITIVIIQTRSHHRSLILVILIFIILQLIEHSINLVFFLNLRTIRNPLRSDDFVSVEVVHGIKPILFVDCFVLTVKEDDFGADNVDLKWTFFLTFLENFCFIYYCFTCYAICTKVPFDVLRPRDFIFNDSTENTVVAHLSPLKVLANLCSFISVGVVLVEPMLMVFFQIFIKIIHRAGPS